MPFVIPGLLALLKMYVDTKIRPPLAYGLAIRRGGRVKVFGKHLELCHRASERARSLIVQFVTEGVVTADMYGQARGAACSLLDGYSPRWLRGPHTRRSFTFTSASRRRDGADEGLPRCAISSLRCETNKARLTDSTPT